MNRPTVHYMNGYDRSPGERSMYDYQFDYQTTTSAYVMLPRISPRARTVDNGQ